MLFHVLKDMNIFYHNNRTQPHHKAPDLLVFEQEAVLDQILVFLPIFLFLDLHLVLPLRFDFVLPLVLLFALVLLLVLLLVHWQHINHSVIQLFGDHSNNYIRRHNNIHHFWHLKIHFGLLTQLFGDHSNNYIPHHNNIHHFWHLKILAYLFPFKFHKKKVLQQI